MNPKALLETLQSLEVAAFRSDRRELDRLLHPRFRELGRSGRVYSKAEVLEELPGHGQTHEIWAQSFEVETLSGNLALLTYQSADVKGEGKLERHTLRASLWQLGEEGWQMRFHQGTPTQPFSRDGSPGDSE